MSDATTSATAHDRDGVVLAIGDWVAIATGFFDGEACACVTAIEPGEARPVVVTLPDGRVTSLAEDDVELIGTAEDYANAK